MLLLGRIDTDAENQRAEFADVLGLTRIEQLRATAPITTATEAPPAAASDHQVARALAAQLREAKRRHHEATTES